MILPLGDSEDRPEVEQFGEQGHPMAWFYRGELAECGFMELEGSNRGHWLWMVSPKESWEPPNPSGGSRRNSTR